MSEHDEREPAFVREARYLGHDAGLAAASWVEMSEDDARSVLDDVNPAVLDQWRGPNLSGEFADDPTPTSLARDIMGEDYVELRDGSGMGEDEIADAWEEAASGAFSRGLEAHALRVLGRVDDALTVERELEAEADRLREARG